MLSERENINKELEALGAGQLIKNSNSDSKVDAWYFHKFKTKILSTIDDGTKENNSSFPIKKWLTVTSVAAVLALGVLFIIPKKSDDLLQQVTKADAAYYLSIYEDDFVDEDIYADKNLLNFSNDSFNKEFLELYLFND